MEHDRRLRAYEEDILHSLPPPRRQARAGLSHELLEGFSPGEFSEEARSLSEAAALSPQVRERLKQRLIEHLKTPVDTPSWGPDWVSRREPKRKPGRLKALFAQKAKENPKADDAPAPVLSEKEQSDSQVIVRNLERSRQVAQYNLLYIVAAVLATIVAALALYVDYQIINGDVWTRALADEFMVVPESLRGSVAFKSLQVVFAALAIHFMLKITGTYGRNALISAAFVFTLVMVGCLGYLVAYNNMDGATAVGTAVQNESAAQTQPNAIDALFAAIDGPVAEPAPASEAVQPAPQDTEVALPLPRLSRASLAHSEGWLWLAFASVIFFIVTTICALYMEVVENNVRNILIARDYQTRRRQYTQLHLLELASGPN